MCRTMKKQGSSTKKKVAVPPGATKIEVRVTPFSNNGTVSVSGPDAFTVDAVSVTPVP